MIPAILIQIVIVLIIVGLILWAISQFPIDATIAKLIRVITIVALCIWLISLLLGISGYGHGLFRY